MDEKRREQLFGRVNRAIRTLKRDCDLIIALATSGNDKMIALGDFIADCDLWDIGPTIEDMDDEELLSFATAIENYDPERNPVESN